MKGDYTMPITARTDHYAETMRRQGTGPARAKLPEPSEMILHKALIGHLQTRCQPGIWWHHSPNGEQRSAVAGGKLKAMGAKAGVPDLMFVRGGRVLFLELKRKGGRISPVQRVCHLELIRAGAIVLVAYGIDEALATLLNAGIIRPG